VILRLDHVAFAVWDMRLLVQIAQSSLSVEEQDEVRGRQPLGSVLEVASR
jgi:hypothetical protein